MNACSSLTHNTPRQANGGSAEITKYLQQRFEAEI
jgi:hypothetical protein